MTHQMPYRIALLADDLDAADAVRRTLRAREDFEVVLEAPCGARALVALERFDADLVILLVDRLEPRLFEGLQTILRHGTAVVLSSQVPADAVLAYKAGATDFVPRPVESLRLGTALDRARRELETRGASSGRREAAAREPAPSGGYVTRVVARSRNRWVVIRSEDILQIEANRNYVRVHSGGSPMRVRQTIRELERMLDPQQFFRVHRSFIVRLDEVREMSALRDGDYQLVLRDGSKVPLSRSRREAFFEALSRRGPDAESLLRAS